MYGQRIREQRIKLGLTMKDFGKKFNLAESTISGYENESRKPDIEIIEKFADFFNVKVDYLLGRTNDPSPTDQKSSNNESMLKDPDVQWIARSKKELTPKQFQRMMELAKKAKEMFEEDDD